MISFAKEHEKDHVLKIEVGNQPAIKMAKNNASSNRTKHTDVKYHLIRSSIDEVKLYLHYCRTNGLVADIFTIPLEKNLFEIIRQNMSVG